MRLDPMMSAYETACKHVYKEKSFERHTIEASPLSRDLQARSTPTMLPEQAVSTNTLGPVRL
jgi:hypothetical protein